MSGSLRPHGLYSPWTSPGQNTGVAGLSRLQGVFPTQGSNLALPHCRRILYQLSHQGSPGILEWGAEPVSSGSKLERKQAVCAFDSGAPLPASSPLAALGSSSCDPAGSAAFPCLLHLPGLQPRSVGAARFLTVGWPVGSTAASFSWGLNSVLNG